MTVFPNVFMLQIMTDLQTQLVLEFTEMTFLIIFISVAVFIIMATPITLFYFALDNYFKWKASKNIIDKDLCCKNNKSHSTYVSQICSQYRKSFTHFISNTFALVAWNIFSLLYISLYFTNLKTGFYSYFLSPFEVIESLSIDSSIETLTQFKTKGLYMFTIFILSLLFFRIGTYVAQFLLENNISFSLKEKIFTTKSKVASTFLKIS
jgi:hypothetical protein